MLMMQLIPVNQGVMCGRMLNVAGSERRFGNLFEEGRVSSQAYVFNAVRPMLICGGQCGLGAPKVTAIGGNGPGQSGQ